MNWKKYILSNEIDDNLRKHHYRQLQIVVCGYCFAGIILMVMLAQLNSYFEWF